MKALHVPSGVEARDINVQGIRTRVFEVDPRNGVTPLLLLHGGGDSSTPDGVAVPAKFHESSSKLPGLERCPSG